MSQHYTDPKRASDPHALPDLEIWYHDAADDVERFHDTEGAAEYVSEPGWYYQACFPGCLPSGEPIGPFETEADALADARDGLDDEEGS